MRKTDTLSRIELIVYCWVCGKSQTGMLYPGKQGRTKLGRLVFDFSMGFATLDRVPTLLYTSQDSYLTCHTLHVENNLPPLV